MKKVNNNLVLIFLVACLIVACIICISNPIRFESQLSKREIVVKERLLKIRVAEEAYLETHGVYADNLRTLVKEGLLEDSLRFIPFTDRLEFNLSTSQYMSKSGKKIPVMECGTTFDEYLEGLNRNDVATLIEQATSLGKYPGLKIGDILMPNDNIGNWE